MTIEQLQAENARLKAEVESLKKPAVIGGYNISEYIRMANSETLEFDNGDIFADMTLPDRIKYIVESHARLKAEVERLRASSFVTAVPVEEYEKLKADFHQAHDERADYAKDVSFLKADVERLRKAGDAMAEALDLNDDVFDYRDKKEAQAAWNAAKEGKPSV